jgi:PAS domain-containing protein
MMGLVIYYGHRRRSNVLHHVEDDYRSMVENANDGIFTIDKEGRFTYLNEAALKFSGYTKDEIMNQNLETSVERPCGIMTILAPSPCFLIVFSRASCNVAGIKYTFLTITSGREETR